MKIKVTREFLEDLLFLNKVTQDFEFEVPPLWGQDDESNIGLAPIIISQDGQPAFVVLKIDEYENLLSDAQDEGVLYD